MKRGWPMAAAAIPVMAAVVLWWWFQPVGQLVYHGIVENQEVRLGSKVGGRVDTVEVREGQLVKAGEVLVRLEAPELKAQRAQAAARLAAATAGLNKAIHGARAQEKDAALAAVEAAQARVALLKTGWRTEEIRQALAEFEASDANLRFAKDEFERQQTLLGRNVAPKADFDSAKAGWERARGQFDVSKAKLDMVRTGARKEDVDEALAELKRADANHRLILAGTRLEDIDQATALVSELQAKVSEIDAQIAETEVRAPSAASIEVLAVRKGDLVAPNQPVVRILSRADVWVKAFVPEMELAFIANGNRVEVFIEAMRNTPFAGTVMQVASISEFTPRNVQTEDGRKHQVFGVKIHVEDPQGVLKAGMAAQVRLAKANQAKPTGVADAGN